METLVERVKCFVSDQAGVDKSCLEMETTIIGDLCFEGGLGLELMMEFADEFKVDMSRFDVDAYFGPESGLIPRSILKWFRIHRDPPEWFPIRIRDLVAAAECGEWRPAIGSRSS